MAEGSALALVAALLWVCTLVACNGKVLTPFVVDCCRFHLASEVSTAGSRERASRVYHRIPNRSTDLQPGVVLCALSNTPSEVDLRNTFGRLDCLPA